MRAYSADPRASRPSVRVCYIVRMSADESVDPRVGTVVAERYRLLEMLDSGAMGVVYRAERVGINRPVAVKFLHAMFSKYPEFTKRFTTEAQAMSRLDHPNCVSVIDFGTADGPFIVMDFVDGPTLKELIAEGPVPVARTADICRQVLAAISHAHEQSIIHRDIKPANIKLSTHAGTGDRARILDFGLAKLRDTDASASLVSVGTPNYMSPEQASGRAVDARTDLYSTGVVLFEMLTGAKPFTADEPYAVLLQHREQPPPALRDKLDSPAFTPALEAIVSRALAKDPDARFQTPEEFAEALRLLGVPATGERAASPAVARTEILAESAPRPGARRPRRHGLLVVVMLLVAAAGAAVYLGVPQRWISAWQDTDRDEPETPTAHDIHSVADARAVADAGHREVAISGLHLLRRAQPDNAEIPYVLGTLYIAKAWYVEAIAAYREALGKDARYGERPDVIRDVVAALGDDAAFDKARALILNHVRDAATSELRDAQQRSPGTPLGERATEILRELDH